MSDLYSRRQKKLLELLGESAAVVWGADARVRSFDTCFPFRQDSNLFYLTGCHEKRAVLILSPSHKEHKTTLFVPSISKEKAQWEGSTLSPEEIKKNSKVDQIHPLDKMDEKLPVLLENHDLVYMDFYYEDCLTKIKKATHSLIQRKRRKTIVPSGFMDLIPLVGKMRLDKDSSEIKMIEAGMKITKEAHLAAMAMTKPGKNEREIQALLEYVFMRKGTVPAYGSIVAGGNNANTLHYISNDKILNKGDLLLIDAGCENKMYATDITRTFPVSGKFTSSQKEVYEIVLQAQKEAIALCKPGNNLTVIHKKAVEFLTRGLIDLKVLGRSLEEEIKKEGYKKYYMHGTGHWLGLDVHDNGPYLEKKKPISFEEGHIFTVEPGLYFPQDDDSLPSNLRGMGIRIEDDILITKTGHRVLSESIPKSIPEIEKACEASINSFF